MKLHWQYDYGDKSETVNLYYGPYYIGLVSRMVTKDWRSHLSNNHSQYSWYERVEDRPYRIHLMTCEDGSQYGRFATLEEAMENGINKAQSLMKEYDDSSPTS